MIWDQYERIKRENDQISETNCTVLLEKLYGPIKANIRNGKYSVAGGHKKYRHDFKTLKEKYRNSKESLGPKVPFHTSHNLFDKSTCSVQLNEKYLFMHLYPDTLSTTRAYLCVIAARPCASIFPRRSLRRDLSIVKPKQLTLC